MKFDHLLNMMPHCLLFCSQRHKLMQQANTKKKKKLEPSRIQQWRRFSFTIDLFFYYSVNCFRHWMRETLLCCLSPIFSPKPKGAKGLLNELFSLLWFCGLRLLGQMQSTYLLAAGHMCLQVGSVLLFSIFFFSFSLE